MKRNQTQRATLSVDQTAELLGVSRSTIFSAVREGRIPAVRIGKRIVIGRKTLEALLEHGNNGRPAA